WLAVVTPAALMNIWAGHYGFLHGALFLLGWSHLDRRPRLAGFFFGCMLVKPHIAVLVPIALLLRRSWVAIVSAAVTVVMLIAATSLLYGWETWQSFILNMVGPQTSLIDARNGFFTYMSASTTTAVLRMTGSHAVALAAQLIVAGGALVTLVLAALRKPPTADFALLTATLTFLVLPYGFNYDLTVVEIGALAILVRSELPLKWRVMAAIGFLAPSVGMLFSASRIAIMPAMLALLAYSQFRTLRPSAVSPTPD
ncbi:MAG TPA: glycosyltransferase family 87 protein, partial [Sphingomicrobium sp.]